MIIFLANDTIQKKIILYFMNMNYFINNYVFF